LSNVLLRLRNDLRKFAKEDRDFIIMIRVEKERSGYKIDSWIFDKKPHSFLLLWNG